jgi:hypothetical protein
VDMAAPGRARPAPTIATGNVSVPRKAGPLATVAYQHGTSVSFYDVPSIPNVFGELEERGESFDGPPSSTLRVRLRENAVDRWRPDAPIRVCHSPDDEEVPFEEVLVPVDRLRDRGADVTVRPLPGFDHVNSWVQAMPRAVRYFRSR